MIEVSCIYCGQVFEAKDTRSKVCAKCGRERNYVYVEKPIITRKCHDCGKPTNDYRCETCLGKWRARNDVPICGGDEVEWVEVPC